MDGWDSPPAHLRWGQVTGTLPLKIFIKIKIMEKEKDYSTFTHLSLLEDSGLQSQVKGQEYF